MSEPPGRSSHQHPFHPALLLVLATAYTAAALAATWPFIFSFKTNLPASGDPSQHLWIMRWNRDCLLEGRLPFVCPELQAPVGAPLGLFSPLHVQSILFTPLSLAIDNDVLTYNLIWLIGLVTTGLGTYALAWTVVRDRLSAAVGGLLAMLSAPVLLHAHAHLELHFLGGLAIFLAAWTRFLDRPGRGRLAAAVGTYALMGACAAYFVVLAVVPAYWMAILALVRAARLGGRPALRGRLAWLVAFGLLALPVLAVLLSNQIWASLAGYSMARTRAEFTARISSAPLWSYLAPSPYHAVARLLPFEIYNAAGTTGYFVIERASYLGIVTLALLNVALVRRAGFRRPGLWWSVLLLLVVLGLGATTRLGEHRIILPAFWLWKHFPPFQLIRTAARFNLLVAVVAAVVAAGGLRWLLSRLDAHWKRLTLAGCLAILATADLALVPYRDTHALPKIPACYAWLKSRDPQATLFEFPIAGPAWADRTYWQSIHRCSTSEGYSGISNVRFVERISLLTPLATHRPDFLNDPQNEQYGPLTSTSFDDYLWLFLQTHGYRYVVIHRHEREFLGDPAAFQRLLARLAQARIFQDDDALVFDRSLLPAPTAPTLCLLDGWRTSVTRPGPLVFGTDAVASLATFAPESNRRVRLEMQAAAVTVPRLVRVRANGFEVARFRLDPGDPRSIRTTDFTLPAGLGRITLETDGAARPSRREDVLDEGRTPYSLRISSLRLVPNIEVPRIATAPTTSR